MTIGWKHAWVRRRRAVALVACAVWLVGLELGPNLHLALHDALAAHDHGGPPTPKFRVEPSRKHAERVAKGQPHRHGDVVHHHGADERAPADDPPPERDHAGGLAHRDDLFAAAPFVLVTPAPVDPPGVVIEATALLDGTWRAAPVAAARGPPATHAPA
jgi:hypothetical protein